MKEPTEGSLTLPRHDAGTPPEDRGFRGDIQGLRALAVGLVVLYHLGGHPLLAPGGFIGVDVFFVISGYVITGLLERERTGSPRDLLPGFYARRARRIIPAVTVLIVVTVLAATTGSARVEATRSLVTVDGRRSSWPTGTSSPKAPTTSRPSSRPRHCSTCGRWLSRSSSIWSSRSSSCCSPASVAASGGARASSVASSPFRRSRCSSTCSRPPAARPRPTSHR